MKFIKLATNAAMEERKSISEKLQKREVKLSHFAIDGDEAYHYYLILVEKTKTHFLIRPHCHT